MGKTSQRAALIKKQEDLDNNSFSSSEYGGVPLPSTDSTVKVEESEWNLKNQLAALADKEDNSSQQSDSGLYCKVCNNGHSYYDKDTYNRHLRTAIHKRMANTELVQPDEFDMNNHCQLCNKTLKTTRSYGQHLISIHKMQLTPLQLKSKLGNNPPTFNNTSNYCDSCKLDFTSRDSYLCHLKSFHEMIIPTLRSATLNSTSLPDIDDLNHYCKACKIKYKNQYSYRQHLRYIHQMKLLRERKRAIYDSTISTAGTQDLKNTICAICDKKYSTRYYYQIHVKKIHKDTMPVTNTTTAENFKTQQPDPMDPDFFCLSCKKSYASRWSYRFHIRLIHPSVQLKKSLEYLLRVEMDAGNRHNKRCTICEREYRNRPAYLTHVKSVHKDGRRGKVANQKNKKQIIDHVQVEMNDGNISTHRCTICERDYASRSSHRKHIKKYHKDIEVEPVICQQSTVSKDI